MATKGKKVEIYYTSQGTTTGIDSSALIFNGKDLNIQTHGKIFKGTDTDTKVTSVDNHYAPSANENAKLTSTASSTGNYALNTEYSVVTGVSLQRDAKGHVTGITTTNQKIKDTNTTYTVNDNKFSVKSKIGSTTTTVSDFTANQSSDDDFTLVQGNNITFINDTTNRTLTIAGTPDTKVTSVDNHYAPSANNDSSLNANASGAAAEWSIDVVKGVNIQRDAKGHVTGLSVTSGKIPGNPNTHYTATPVLGATSSTSNVTSDTTNDATFLNIVENNTKSGGVQIKGSGTTSVSAKNGILTISSSDSKTGTVTKVSTGIGLTGGDITTTGTIKAKLKDETPNSADSAKSTSSSGGLYSVEADKSGNLAVRVPWTDTNTHVTAVGNHYTPSANTDASLNSSASSTGNYAINTEYSVVTGINIQRDAKGHVTGVTTTNQKVKDTNTWQLGSSSQAGYVPTATKGKYLHSNASTGNLEWVDDRYEANTDRYVNSAAFADDTTNNAASPLKMTLTRAGSDSATVVANLPKVSSTSAGIAPKGTAVSSQSQSTKFLREDGSWATPSYTTNTNSAKLQVSDTTNKKINTAESAGNYIQFTGGTNEFTVSDGTNSFKVGVTPSIANNVTGSSLTADKIVLGNGSSAVKTSSKGITTTLGNDDTTVPTSKAVQTAITNATGGLTSAMHFIGTSSTAVTDGGTETPTIEGYSGTAKTPGNVVLYSGKEFIWTGSAWELFGDEGSYALKTIKVEGTGVLGGGGTLENNRTITHNTSGVIAASYGPTANVTGTEGTTIKVPQITVDSYGHITAVTERTYTSKNSTYTVNNGTYSIKSKVGDTTTTVSDFTANQSGADDFTLIQGSNITFTNDTTNRTLTIAGKAGTVTSVATGVGLTGGTITGSGTLKAKLKDETLNSADSSKSTSSSGGLYSVEADKSGNLAVRVPWTDKDTWKAASTSQEGYVPKLATGGGTIATQSTEYVLTFKSGTDTAPVWRLLPANAYTDHTYTIPTVNNATYSVKSKIGDTTTTLSDFTANQSGNDDFTLIQGSNITFSNDATNRTLTIAGTPNTWRPVGTGASDAAAGNHTHGISIAADSGTNQLSLAAGTKYKLTAGGQSYIFTTPADNNTWKAASTSQEGYVPKLSTGGGTIATQASEYVLTFKSGTDTAPVWRLLPANAYKNDDTNTWRGIQNNLTSDSTSDSLSAAQGKALANGSARDNTKLPLSGGIMTGTISASDDAYGGGGFHNGYANIILRGNATTGTSGIVFSSSKGSTSINRPSDCGFIQFHPYGVTASAVSTNPTIGTSGEANKLVIGVNNDADDQLWLQTPDAGGLKHVVGANVYNILDSANSSVSLSGSTLTVKINGTSQSLTNTNTWNAVSSTVDGYVPKTGTAAAATISSQANEWVLTTTSGGTPSWRALPANAFNNSTYKFSGSAFYSGNSGSAEKNANNVASNAITYYTSNGPTTSQGATTNDGALYVQAYSTSWVGQIAQDYRNGRLFVRGKNNGAWTGWLNVLDSGNSSVSLSGSTLTVKINGVEKSLTNTDNDTWKAASTSQEGYVPKLSTGGGTIATQASEYVLTFKSGTDTAPVWRLLPANAYNDHTYTVNNGTYSIKSLVGSTATTLSDFTANQSGNDDFTLVQGSNITFTNDTTNRRLTIAAANTWTALSSTAAGYVPKAAGGVASSSSNTYYFLGYTGTTVNWYQLPANAFNNTPNTDSNVAQSRSTTNQESPILLKNGTGTGNLTSGTIFASGVTINPSTSSLSISGNLTVSGTASFSNNVTMSGSLEMYSNIIMNSNNVEFKGSDPGDLVWKDANGNEVHRIWDSSGTLSYRANGSGANALIHAGNIASFIPTNSIIDSNNVKIKHVNFGYHYAYNPARIIVPFKYFGGGAHEGCLFPIYGVADSTNAIGLTIVWLENYTVGGQNNRFIEMGANHAWGTAGNHSDGRVIIKTLNGNGWTYCIPWVMWTTGPHWAEYYNLDFSVLL